MWLCPTRLSMALTGGSSAKSQQDVTEGFCIVETNYRVSLHGLFAPVFMQLQHEPLPCSAQDVLHHENFREFLRKFHYQSTGKEHIKVLKNLVVCGSRAADHSLARFVLFASGLLADRLPGLGMIRALTGCWLIVALKRDLTSICWEFAVSLALCPRCEQADAAQASHEQRTGFGPTPCACLYGCGVDAWSGKHHQH